jgi:putative endonuclease
VLPSGIRKGAMIFVLIYSARPSCHLERSERSMPKENRYYVYLLTNKNDKVMCVGVTSDLKRRVYEHKNKLIPGFTERYNVNKLVYFEETRDIRAAIVREKEIKKWHREKKNNLVVFANPKWKDLSEGGVEISHFVRDDTVGPIK